MGKKGIITLCASALLAAGATAGGFLLKGKLDAKYAAPDREDIEAKTLIVGTDRTDTEGGAITLRVGLHPVDSDAIFYPDMESGTAEMSYSASGQQSPNTCWSDLSDWVAESIGVRLDVFCEGGGRISFQTFSSGYTSERIYRDYGQGCYWVGAPAEDGAAPSITHNTVSVMIPELDIQ